MFVLALAAGCRISPCPNEDAYLHSEAFRLRSKAFPYIDKISDARGDWKKAAKKLSFQLASFAVQDLVREYVRASDFETRDRFLRVINRLSGHMKVRDEVAACLASERACLAAA